MDHLNFRIQLLQELLKLHGKVVEIQPIVRPSKTLMQDQSTVHHFTERIPSTEKKANHTKDVLYAARRWGMQSKTPS